MKKRLYHRTQAYDLVRATEAVHGAARMVFRSVAAASAFLHRVGHSGSVSIALRRVLLEDFGNTRVVSMSDDEVRASVAELIASRQLLVYTNTLFRSTVGTRQEDEPAEVEQLEALDQQKTWIEIELLDMENNPVAGARYWIKLPDESIREGRLNAQGRAYFGGLDPGNCVIRWPDLDDEATIPAPPVATQPPVREKTWIEIELLDMEGNPVPRERYHVKLPDGSIREGRLNDQGTARFDGIDAGDCEIRWPDREEEALVTLDSEGDGAMATDHLDAEQQAAALEQAAADGVPFCAECDRLRREREARAASGGSGAEANAA